MQNPAARTIIFPIAAGVSAQFGGRYVAETLMPALFELEKAYTRWRGAIRSSATI